MRPSVDDLHEAMFGFRPSGLGKCYERLAAIVFAHLGWADVVFDTIRGVPGRRAKHQIDVTARLANGQTERAIIECKDWDKGVGKATLDALVGIRTQLRADLAIVVTTERYTRGARAVAVDEGVMMLRLQPIDPDDLPDYVRSASVKLVPTVPQFSAVALFPVTTASEGNPSISISRVPITCFMSTAPRQSASRRCFSRSRTSRPVATSAERSSRMAA
jgi:hypothetical protein